jgi:hypothetical protein
MEKTTYHYCEGDANAITQPFQNRRGDHVATGSFSLIQFREETFGGTAAENNEVVEFYSSIPKKRGVHNLVWQVRLASEGASEGISFHLGVGNPIAIFP